MSSPDSRTGLNLGDIFYDKERRSSYGRRLCGRPKSLTIEEAWLADL